MTEGFLPGQGLRARGKRERRRRLQLAARQVFLKRGYEGATTREIAARADVAIGTLFVYANEKRDLLFLTLNDDLDAMVETSAGQIATDQPLIKQLMDVFRPIYKYFASNVVIGRYGIHEIFLLQDEKPDMLGTEARRVLERREKLCQTLATIIDRLKAAGRLSTSAPAREIAEVFLWLHWCNVQSWLSTKSPRAEAGAKALRRILTMVIQGLGPKSAEV